MIRKIFKVLSIKIRNWAKKAESDLIHKMDTKTEELNKKLEVIVEKRNTQVAELHKHYQDMHNESEQEFMKNNREIAERYKRTQARLERELTVAQELVQEAHNNVELSKAILSMIRGMIHSRTQTMGDIQRSTALLGADLKVLQGIEEQLLNVKGLNEKTIRKEQFSIRDSSVRTSNLLA
jgi:head-tail adaptor